ncbi:MAG TPA: translation initiation factor IF-2 [Thermoplasmataceae archaeon]|nr:translation initiation factor IF-2 [Thermoplasmataceae archaeon]
MYNNSLRQPIVCVLGHVDHGKTTILDAIRGTYVAKKEVGGITQRIGATNVDVKSIEKDIKKLLGGKSLRIPGLLFIDTPGHVAFANMRARGGALADIAILVVDINEGLMPQTVESINILKKFKTPFIIVANKIDLVPLVREANDVTFKEFEKEQRPEYIEELDKRLYNLVNNLYSHGLQSDRYDRVRDFTKTVAIIPASGKMRVGIQDTLVTLSGLAQRFLEKNITFSESEGRGTVIEVKREESLGTTLDTVLYQGKLKKGDSIAINTNEGPKVTRIKAMLVNPGTRGSSLQEKNLIVAASGVRILITDRFDVIPGSPIIVVGEDPSDAFEEILKESQPDIELSPNGVTIKAEALGSLEALSFELNQHGIPIRSAQIGDITKRDIVDAETLNEPLDRIILGFNVSFHQEAREESMATDVGVMVGNVIYSLVDDTEKWLKDKKREIEEARKSKMPIPSKITIIPDYIFRTTKPVIVGVKIHTGEIKVGDRLIKADGRSAGTIKSIRDNEVNKRSASAPAEVAISIEGVTLNRHIFPSEALYVDISEDVVKKLREHEMDPGTMETLEEIIKIKRKENIFWGTKA